MPKVWTPEPKTKLKNQVISPWAISVGLYYPYCFINDWLFELFYFLEFLFGSLFSCYFSEWPFHSNDLWLSFWTYRNGMVLHACLDEGRAMEQPRAERDALETKVYFSMSLLTLGKSLLVSLSFTFIVWWDDLWRLQQTWVLTGLRELHCSRLVCASWMSWSFSSDC